MTVSEFEDCIARHGGTLEAWPEGARLAALALLETTPQAVRLLDQARRFDRLFMLDDVPPPPAVAAILSRATARRPLSVRDRLLAVLGPEAGAFSWLHAGGLAACLVAGVIIGSLAPHREGLQPALLDFAVGGHVGFSAQLDSADE